MTTLYIQYPAAGGGGGGGGLTISVVQTPLMYDVPTQTLSIQQSSTLLDGYLSAVNFNIFNNKQPAGSYITALTGDVTATGPGSVAATIANLAVTNAKIANATIDLTSKVTGVLPIANGGTNSATVLSNNRVMQSSGGAIIEAAAITAARALISDANGIPTHSVTTAAELAFSSGVTSNIQTQLNAKEPTITVLPIAKGGTNSSTALNNNRIMISSAGAIVEDAAITANRALASDVSGIPVASATTDTELGYVSGVTSAIQTQLNGKQATGNYITALTGDVTATGPGSVAATIANDAVTTVKILNANVTSAKIAAAAVDLTTQVNSVLPEANGGTNQSTYTTGDTLYASASNTLSKLPIGTAAQVLTVSAGVPAWMTPSAAGASVLNQQVFTSIGANTFTIPVGTVAATVFKFTIVAGGGGGAGGNASDSGGGGGGGGSCIIKYLSGLTAGNTIIATVGAGGSGGGGATAGSNGNSSQIASGTETITSVIAGSGLGGTQDNTLRYQKGGKGGSTSAPGAPGDINIDGTAGGLGVYNTAGSAWGGDGGPSGLAGGGGSGGNNDNSTNGDGTAGFIGGGGGGGGAAAALRNSGAASGGDGIVIVEWVL